MAEAESEAVQESVPVEPAGVRAETEAVESLSEVRAASFRAEQLAGLLPPGLLPPRRAFPTVARTSLGYERRSSCGLFITITGRRA
jgi:hypothetical protein